MFLKGDKKNAVVAATLFICACANAEIYEVVDAKTGEVSYTNQRPAGASLATADGSAKDRAAAKTKRNPAPRPQAADDDATGDTASAQPYVVIAEIGGATYLLNVRAFSGPAGNVGAWVMTNWATSQSLNKSKDAATTRNRYNDIDPLKGFAAAVAKARGFRSTLTLYRFGCQARRMYPEETIHYDETFAQGNIVDHLREGGPGSNVIPGTVNETILARLCAHARSRGIVTF